jgi:hypothetical protein
MLSMYSGLSLSEADVGRSGPCPTTGQGNSRAIRGFEMNSRIVMP